jgi:hypothetical protein
MVQCGTTVRFDLTAQPPRAFPKYLYIDIKRDSGQSHFGSGVPRAIDQMGRVNAEITTDAIVASSMDRAHRLASIVSVRNGEGSCSTGDTVPDSASFTIAAG